MHVRTRLALFSALLLGAVAPVGAQANVAAPADTTPVALMVSPTPSADSVVTTTAPAAGASMTGLRAGVHARETARPTNAALLQSRAGLGQARAMMVVGVAALFAGAIIGGDAGTIIMVGGAVIGLIGLYDYLQ